MSDGVNPVLNWDNGIAPPPGFRPPPTIDPTVANNNDADYFSKNFGKAPRIPNWSFNIQHEIAQYLIEVGYVGNRGTRMNSTTDLNQLPVDRLSLGQLAAAAHRQPGSGCGRLHKPYANLQGTLAQALRPYPQYFNVSERNSGVGRTWYDSLQAKVERRFGDFQLSATLCMVQVAGLGYVPANLLADAVIPAGRLQPAGKQELLVLRSAACIEYSLVLEHAVRKGQEMAGYGRPVAGLDCWRLDTERHSTVPVEQSDSGERPRTLSGMALSSRATRKQMSARGRFRPAWMLLRSIRTIRVSGGLMPPRLRFPVSISLAIRRCSMAISGIRMFEMNRFR